MENVMSLTPKGNLDEDNTNHNELPELPAGWSTDKVTKRKKGLRICIPVYKTKADSNKKQCAGVYDVKR